MSSNLKALHTYFYSLQENPKKKSPARLKERKKRIIELIIKENHCCDPGTRRKMRKTLPLGIFQKKKEKKEASSNLANRKNTDFGSG
jgi:hypothetical protein